MGGSEMKVMLKRLAFLLGLFACLVLVGCGDDDGGVGTDENVDNTNFSAQEPFHFRVDVVGQQLLELDAMSGTIAITGVAESDSVVIAGVRRVRSESTEDAEEYLQYLEIDVNNLQNRVQVITVQPSKSYGRSYEVDYEILVPEEFVIFVESINGPISIDSIENTVTFINVNGDVSLDDMVGSVSGALVNGDINATVDLPDGGILSLAVTNGDIDLLIPQTTSAEFSATVTNGDIDIDNLTLTGQEITATSWTGTLGAGDGTISLIVTNGMINVTGF
jgi:hypothetical protein